MTKPVQLVKLKAVLTQWLPVETQALIGEAAQQVVTLAHKLKSSARSVGAMALGELCAQMELAGQVGQPELLARLWPEFEREIAAVRVRLEAS